MRNGGKLREVAALFFKLGCIAFGGPAAHIAMMEDEVVKKRKWMSHEHFLDLIGATNLIPGPNSTEMTMHCGYERAGYAGLLVAGFCFIFPAAVITSIFAWAYHQYGALHEVEPFIYGIKPAVIAIIISAVIPLAKKSFKNIELIILGILTAVAVFFGVHEIVALFACGFTGVLLYLIYKKGQNLKAFIPVFFLQLIFPPPSLPNYKIFLVFFKIGALLYGSGYVLLAYLDAELVAKGYLSTQGLIDAVAVGQFTPGPVFTTATFIGCQMNGPAGAVAATVGIFLPAFIFVAILNPLIPKIRKYPAVGAFMDAVNVAAVALIFVIVVHMSRAAVEDWRAAIIAAVSLIVAFGFKKVNSALIVLGGGIAGYLLSLV